MEDVLKRRIAAATVAAASVFGLAACSSSSSSAPASAASTGSTSATGTLNVSLITKWGGSEIADAEAAFHQKYPNVKVNITYQTWGTYLSKFEAEVQSGQVPDVIEVGNTDTPTPVAGNAFEDITSIKSSFPNSSSWTAGLTSTCTYGGKLYCVPYYAGDRMLGYNSTQWTAAGITSAPTDWATFVSDLQKLDTKNAGTKGYSALYVPAGYEYFALSFVVDAGAQIATQNSAGQWQMNLESTQAQAGLANYFKLFNLSKANQPGVNEAKQDPYYDNATAGALYGGTWDFAAPTGGTVPTTAYFPIPSPTTPGSFLPDFIGGSDLAVPAASKNTAWANEFVADLTSSKVELEYTTDSASPSLPNASNLASEISDPTLKAFAAGLATGYGTPNAANWAQINGSDIYIDDMLEAIAKAGGTSAAIATYTKQYDAKMDAILNK
jgi:N,N'-diacetylchitobiose transport system substrate-binding protein